MKRNIVYFSDLEVKVLRIITWGLSSNSKIKVKYYLSEMTNYVRSSTISESHLLNDIFTNYSTDNKNNKDNNKDNKKDNNDDNNKIDFHKKLSIFSNNIPSNTITKSNFNKVNEKVDCNKSTIKAELTEENNDSKNVSNSKSSLSISESFSNLFNKTNVKLNANKLPSNSLKTNESIQINNITKTEPNIPTRKDITSDLNELKTTTKRNEIRATTTHQQNSSTILGSNNVSRLLSIFNNSSTKNSISVKNSQFSNNSEIKLTSKNAANQQIKPFLENIQSLKSTKRELDEIKESFIDAFFICGLSKDTEKFIPYSEQYQSQCKHDFCSNLSSISPEILYKYPSVDSKEIEINSCVASMFFSSGIKICYAEDESTIPELDSYDTTLTNQEGQIFYLQSYKIYQKVPKYQFDKFYKLNIKDELLQINQMMFLLKNTKGKKERSEKRKFERKLEIFEQINFKDFVYLPLAFVFVSKQPYLLEMKTILKEIVISLTNEEYVKDTFIKDLIFLNKDLPIRPVSNTKSIYLNFFFNNLEYPLLLQYPSVSDFPLTPNNTLTVFLLENFSTEDIITIFYLIKTEQKLVFFSNYDNKISKTLSSFLSLLYPLEWVNNYIPILTIEMIKYVQNFMPFIMGVNSEFIGLFKEYLDENNLVYFINIDSGIIFNSSIIINNSSINICNITTKIKDTLYPLTIKERLFNRLNEIHNDYVTIKINNAHMLSSSKRGSLEIESRKNSLSSYNSNINKRTIKIQDFVNNYYLLSISNDKNDYETLFEIRTELINLDKTFKQAFLISSEEEFGEYEKYLSIIDNMPLFNTESFLKIKNPLDKFYFEEILSTQVFLSFLQSNYKSDVVFKEKLKNSLTFLKLPRVSALSERLRPSKKYSTISLCSNTIEEEYCNESEVDNKVQKIVLFNNSIDKDNSLSFYIPPKSLNQESCFSFLNSNTDTSTFYQSYYNTIKKINEANQRNNLYIYSDLSIPNIKDANLSLFKSDKFNWPFTNNQNNNKIKTTINKFELRRRSIIMNNLTNKINKPLKETIIDYISKLLISNHLSKEEKSDFDAILQLDSGRNLFSLFIYQSKFKEGTFHCLDAVSFSNLKAIISIFLVNSGKSKECYENVRLVTKSLFYYLKLNSKHQNIFLGQVINVKLNNYQIWSDEEFWIYYFSAELKDSKIKNQESIFTIILKMINITFDLKIDIKLIYSIMLTKISSKYITNEDFLNKIKFTLETVYNSEDVESKDKNK